MTDETNRDVTVDDTSTGNFGSPLPLETPATEDTGHATAGDSGAGLVDDGEDDEDDGTPGV